jgi:pyruvate formate lyase activating enzyme
MDKCVECGEARYVSRSLGYVCVACIKDRWNTVYDRFYGKRNNIRDAMGLTREAPKTPGGIPCKLCVRECIMGIGESGYCGLRRNVDGRLHSLVSPDISLAHIYLDPHITNCCASYFCPGGTGAGYPDYAYRKGPEYGYYNLAYFFYGCSFTCLFCQNYSLLRPVKADKQTSIEVLDMIRSDERISCICWVGGTPEPQLPFTIKVGRLILEDIDRIVRLCYEWNGTGNWALVKRAGELALESGGIIKFDLKTYSEELSIALSGISNKRSYENFERLFHKYYNDRSSLPLLTATTLLVPGYVGSEEVEGISRFLAELDKGIPYSLLIFHPDHYMRDLPITPVKQVKKSYEVAKKYLKNVNIGNKHLLALAPDE